jgi:hypothetical protein
VVEPNNKQEEKDEIGVQVQPAVQIGRRQGGCWVCRELRPLKFSFENASKDCSPE